MAIYTRTGDKGETSLFGGKRLPKSHARIEAYGSLDELNSLLGVVLSNLNDPRVAGFINQIQKDLFIIGSHLAGSRVSIDSLKERVEEMEKVIDKLDMELPKLTNFILPEGIEKATLIFYARSVGRRAERELVALSSEEDIDMRIHAYLNRLSDLLFILGRYINFKAGIKETIWKGIS